jgi:predicted nucleic acid-binding protein
MSVVLDANFLVALITQHPLRTSAYGLFQQWLDQKVELHAPKLIHYEVTSALTQLIGSGILSKNTLSDACSELLQFPITYHSQLVEPRIVEIALSLGRRSAYDAAYLALAETLAAELWTLDGPLYRNAIRQGFQVRLLEETT